MVEIRLVSIGLIRHHANRLYGYLATARTELDLFGLKHLHNGKFHRTKKNFTMERAIFSVAELDTNSLEKDFTPNHLGLQ